MYAPVWMKKRYLCRSLRCQLPADSVARVGVKAVGIGLKLNNSPQKDSNQKQGSQKPTKQPGHCG
jgi:hypothetical protein